MHFDGDLGGFLQPQRKVEGRAAFGASLSNAMLGTKGSFIHFEVTTISFYVTNVTKAS